VRRLICLVAILMIPAACGVPSPTASKAPSTTPTGEITSPPAASPTSTATAPSSCPRQTGGKVNHMLLKDVRVGTHSGYDRITFEFTSSGEQSTPDVPEFEFTQSNSDLKYDGSGDPMVVNGNAFFSIVFHGASGYDSNQGYKPVYTGSREFKPGFNILTELEQAGDYEATLSWAIGLSRLTCAVLKELKEPVRLVVDLPA